MSYKYFNVFLSTIFLSFLCLAYILIDIDPYTIIDLSISYKNNIFSRSLVGSSFQMVSNEFNINFVSLSSFLLISSTVLSFALFIKYLGKLSFSRVTIFFILITPFSYAFFLNNYSYVILRRDIFLILIIQIFALFIRKVESHKVRLLIFIIANIIGLFIHIMSVFIVLPVTSLLFIRHHDISYWHLASTWLFCLGGFVFLTFISSDPYFFIDQSLLDHGINLIDYERILLELSNQNTSNLITELKIFIINLPSFLVALIILCSVFYALLVPNITFAFKDYLYFSFFSILILIAHDHGRFFSIFFITFFYLYDDVIKKDISLSKNLLASLIMLFSIFFSLPHYFGLDIIQTSFLSHLIGINI